MKTKNVITKGVGFLFFSLLLVLLFCPSIFADALVLSQSHVDVGQTIFFRVLEPQPGSYVKITNEVQQFKFTDLTQDIAFSPNNKGIYKIEIIRQDGSSSLSRIFTVGEKKSFDYPVDRIDYVPPKNGEINPHPAQETTTDYPNSSENTQTKPSQKRVPSIIARQAYAFVGDEIFFELSEPLLQGQTITIEFDSKQYQLLQSNPKTFSFIAHTSGTFTTTIQEGTTIVSSSQVQVQEPITKKTLYLRNHKSQSRQKEIKIINGTTRNERATVLFEQPVKGVNSILLKNYALEQPNRMGVDLISSDSLNFESVAPEKKVQKAFAIDPEGIDFTDGVIHATAQGTELWKCPTWNFTAQLCPGTWHKILDLVPGQNYTVELSPQDPGFVETGVSTVNTKKPLYHPNETVELIMVVLDQTGNLVENAFVTLTVTDPQGHQTQIIHNPSDPLSPMIETGPGIYETTFTQTVLEGNYSVFVQAQAQQTNASLLSQFAVLNYYPFDILRETVVTTDPWLGPFTSTLHILSHDKFHLDDFVLQERFSKNLTLIQTGGASVQLQNDDVILTWNNLSNNSRVTYVIQPPLVTPDLYTLGPAHITSTASANTSPVSISFFEARPWYVAIDPLSFYDPSSTIAEGWNDGTGTTHTEINDGVRSPTIPTGGQLESVANDNVISEFGFPNIAEENVERVKLYVYTSTGSNAQYTFFLQQNDATVCSIFMPANTAGNWFNCTWLPPDGTVLDNLTLELGGVTKSGSGQPRTAVVRASYLEISFNQAPLVSLLEPSDQEIYGSSTVAFNFSAIDDASTTLQSCTLYTNISGSFTANRTTTTVTNNTKTNITVSHIPEGSYLWSVQCTDVDGYSDFAQENYSVVINSLSPSIQNPSFNVSQLNQTETIFFNVSVADYYGVSSANYTITYPNATSKTYSLTQSGDEWFATFTDTRQVGTYSLSLLQARDTLGQTGQNSSPGISFTVTTSPPAPFNLLTPLNGTESQNQLPTFTWQQTQDNHFENYSLRISLHRNLTPALYTFTNFEIDNTSKTMPFALDTNTRYFWRVVAFDTFGSRRNSSSDFVYITDTKKPTVSLNSPANNAFVLTPSTTFRFTPDDNFSLSNCTLYGNFSGTFAANQTLLSPVKKQINNITIPLEEESYRWNVRCYDRSGNDAYATTNRTVRVDLSGPDIYLMYPENNSLENNTNNVVFSANASDFMTGVNSCQVIVNNQIKSTLSSITENVQFNFTVFLNNGDYNWSVNCTDSNGFKSSSLMFNLSVFVIDNNPPLITINSPENNDYLNNSFVLLNYTVQDATGISNCSLYVNDILNQTCGSGYSCVVNNQEANNFTLENTADDSYSWYVQCVDNGSGFNVASSDALNFTVDTVNPDAFFVINPLNSSVFKRNHVLLNWTQTADTNFANYTVQLDTNPIFDSPDYIFSSTSLTSSFVNATGLADATYFWRVFAYDRAGNVILSTNDTLSFRTSQSPPFLANVSENPLDPVAFNPNTTYTFNVTLVEPALQLVVFQHNFFGTLQNSSPTLLETNDNETYYLEFNTTGRVPATYSYQWIAKDVEGRTSTNGSSYQITKATPVINLSLNGSFSNISINEDSTILLSGNSAIPSNALLTLLRNGVVVTSSTGTVQNNTFFANPGIFNITLRYLGNQNYTARSVSRFVHVNDTTAPTVRLMSPQNNTGVGTLSFSFNFNVSDVSTVTNCSLFIDDTFYAEKTPITKTISQSIPATVTDGHHTWYIACTDSANNTNQSRVYNFTAVDATQITIALTPTNVTVQKGYQNNYTVFTGDVFSNPLISNVTFDFVLGNTSLSWWNTSWKRRKPIFINETQGTNRTNAMTYVNVTGLGGFIEDCRRELRIIQNSTGVRLTQVPFTVYGGDNSTFCFVAFRANISANSVNANNYYAYYNNSFAPNPNYNFNDTTIRLYNAKLAAADLGTPTNVNNIIGRNDATFATISVSGGSSGQAAAHGRALINTSFSTPLKKVMVRYRYSVPTATDPWDLRYSINDGSSYTDALQGTGTSPLTTSTWFDLTSQYSPLNWVQINRTRLQGFVEKGGGAGEVTMQLYWVEMNVSFRTPPEITHDLSTVGQEEKHIERQKNVTAATGDFTFHQQTASLEFENYSAIVFGKSGNLTGRSAYSLIEVVPDSTPPEVTLLLPEDLAQFGVGTFSFTYFPNDPNLDFCTLYIDEGLGFSPVVTNTTPITKQNNSFTNVELGIGLHDWNVNCTDTYNNSGFASQNFTINITGPDLAFLDVYTENASYIENLPLLIFANVTNQGLTDAEGNVTVQFFLGDPETTGIQIGNNITFENLSIAESRIVNVTHVLVSGNNEIFVRVDPGNLFNESDESNNVAEFTIGVPLYHTFYGDVNARILLDTNQNDTFLDYNIVLPSGHVLFSDIDSSFSIASLRALGRNINGLAVNNDFTDADVMLNGSLLNDSISTIWANGGNTPQLTTTLNISSTIIHNVPIANSTNTTAFFTGILWDSDDDEGDLSYSQDDSEDLVFVTRINPDQQGKFGLYDYEARVPGTLRQYVTGTDKIAIYVELS